MRCFKMRHALPYLSLLDPKPSRHEGRAIALRLPGWLRIFCASWHPNLVFNIPGAPDTPGTVSDTWGAVGGSLRKAMLDRARGGFWGVGVCGIFFFFWGGGGSPLFWGVGGGGGRPFFFFFLFFVLWSLLGGGFLAFLASSFSGLGGGGGGGGGCRCGLKNEIMELSAADGTVTGLSSEPGQELRLTARCGVLLATGGFEHEPEHCREQQFPAPTRAVVEHGAGTNAGDGSVRSGRWRPCGPASRPGEWWPVTLWPARTSATNHTLVDPFSCSGKQLPQDLCVNRFGKRSSMRIYPMIVLDAPMIADHAATGDTPSRAGSSSTRLRAGIICAEACYRDDRTRDRLRWNGGIRTSFEPRPIAGMARKIAVNETHSQSVERMIDTPRRDKDPDLAGAITHMTASGGGTRRRTQSLPGTCREAAFLRVADFLGTFGTKGGVRTDAEPGSYFARGSDRAMYAVGNTRRSISKIFLVTAVPSAMP